MIDPGTQAKARRLLERDRGWCAYALADLYPPYLEHTDWLVGREAVVMTFRGFSPPLIFAHGDPAEANDLLSMLPGGEVQYALMGIHRDMIGERLSPSRETRMWRMVFHEQGFRFAQEHMGLVAIDRSNLPDILSLFTSHPDQPDSFDPEQLTNGIYFGIREGHRLVSLAGTHILSQEPGVAALGNVFTHPSRRRQGLARMACAAVVDSLLRRGIRTIVLNVAMDNEPAIRCYLPLGFLPYCGYYEGVGNLSAKSDMEKRSV